jgi:hypothetical protein
MGGTDPGGPLNVIETVPGATGPWSFEPNWQHQVP